MINFKDEDDPQNETVRQTLERVARELGVFGTTPTNNITHSPQSPMQQPTAWSSSPNYSATAANNWQIKPTTSVPQNSNTFGSTPQPSQPAGFTPSPTQPMSQTPAAVANQTGQSSGSTSLFDNPDAIKQQNGQPSPVMQAIYRYLDNTYGQQNIPNIIEQNKEDNTLKQNINPENPDFSGYANSPLYIGLTAQPRQAHLKGLDKSLISNREIVNSPYSNNILENDCYQSERFEPFAKQVRWNEGENQGVIYATSQEHGTDQPTKYGISQGALDLYRKKFDDIARTYPANIKDLSEEQAMNLLCQYYKGSRAEAINDPNLAFSVYDSYFNNPNNAPIAWQQTLKSGVNPNIQVGGGIGSQTINSFNSVQSDAELLDTFIENRKKTLNKKYKDGLINRFRRYPIK